MAARDIHPNFNVPKFNELRFNGGKLTESISTDLVVFNDFSLHNGSTIIVTSIGDSGPSRELLGGSVPREDGEYLNSDYWRRKSIDIAGTLIASSATELETLMDTVRKNLRVAQANLDLTRNAVVRRYVATLINMHSLFPQRQHFHTTWIPFTAMFECRTPFAMDRGYSYVNETLTVSPTTLSSAENQGTIEAYPVITAVIDAADTVTVMNIKRVNEDGDTLDEIEYSGTLEAADTFVFDSEDKTVKKNGAEVDYVGAFPILEVGANLIKVTTTGTSFSVSFTIKWKNRFL